MTTNLFPVMHGSMWKEPQSLSECNDTRCRECAYRVPGGIDCFHRSVLINLGE